MYTLIGSLKTRAVRVLWCLEELGVEYELQDAAPRSPEMTAANPSGKAPALKVGDDIIIDSAAICTYLADKHGKLTYKPGTIERARQDSFMHFAIDEMDGVCWTAAKHRFVLPEQHRVDGVEAACAFEFERSMGLLESRLADHAYMAGDDFTIADIFVVHCANWARGMFQWPIPEGPLSKYLERMRARPAYIRAMEIREAS